MILLLLKFLHYNIFQEVLTYYEVSRSQFPGAVVQASTFEDFVAELQPFKDKLPIVTQEMGDTWIQGVSSDPRKVAESRAFMRVATKCLTQSSGKVVKAKYRMDSEFYK